MPFKTLVEKDFIGRNHELNSLYNLSSEAKLGNATSIFLSGQRGTGKSELVKQLFSLLFWRQDEVMPFFYSVNPAFLSIDDFSKDYLNKFIRQWLAFQKKDISLISANELSLENLRDIAEGAEAKWVVDAIGDILKEKDPDNIMRLFLSAINAPPHSYHSTGIPVIVIIDDFHKTKGLFNPHSETNKSLWTFFEGPIKFKYTPHILTGLHSELFEMFFHQTSIGEAIELFNLSALDKNTSLRLFTSLCESYGLKIDKESILPFIELFNNNPFYIRNFIQSARREEKSLSEEDLWNIYFNEITKGKFYACWTSRLRMYIPQLEMRTVYLKILYHLCNSNSYMTLSSLSERVSISTKELNEMINLLQRVGILEINFSILKLIEDRVLTDVIKVVYNREILEKPLDIIEEELITEGYKKELYREVKRPEKPSFEITIPAISRAELIMVNALEQIAKQQNIPMDIIDELKIAIIDLFNSIIFKEERFNDESLNLKFTPLEDIFVIEIRTPYKTSIPLTPSGKEDELIKRYIDEMRLEETRSGLKITLIKHLKKHYQSPS
jgi:hypothetical protein